MPFAVITIDKIDKREAGYLHFKDKSQKSWNVNVQELVADLAEGECYKIDYAETAPTGNHKYGSKYVNRARTWQASDGDNTWPDKEPYMGLANNVNNATGGSMSKDFDSETSKRQTEANCAAAIYANCMQGSGPINLQEFAITFPVIAEIVSKHINSKGNAAVTDGVRSEQSDDEFENTF